MTMEAVPSKVVWMKTCSTLTVMRMQTENVQMCQSLTSTATVWFRTLTFWTSSLAYGQSGPVWGGVEWVQEACNVEPIPLEDLYTATDYCGAENPAPVCDMMGCTYPAASNYDANATVDSGDCVWTGCTDSAAFNYNPIANLDDDTCNYQVCPDFNNDGQVQAQDLLDFLLAWGMTY